MAYQSDHQDYVLIYEAAEVLVQDEEAGANKGGVMEVQLAPGDVCELQGNSRWKLWNGSAYLWILRIDVCECFWTRGRTTSLQEILEMAMPKVSRYRQQWRSNSRLVDFLKMMKARVSMSPICGLGLRTLVSCTDRTSVCVWQEELRVCVCVWSYSNSWSIFANASIQDDIEVVVAGVEGSSDDADDGKDVQLHSNHG